MAIYDSVNGVARKVTKMYDDVNGVARAITKAYDGVNGVARLYFSSGVAWRKYSCDVISGFYEEMGSSPYDSTAYFIYGASYIIYHDCNFDSGSGYSGNSYTVYQPTQEDTLSSVQALFSGRYLYVGSTYATYVSNVDSITTGENGLSFSFSGTQYNADFHPPTYIKGSTSYGTVNSPEGEFPEEGRLIEGSVADGYCVLLIGSTYYYYVLEE